MITIEANHIGKKYGSNRLFKGFHKTFTYPNNYAITGINGSGKSTFLLILNKFITPTEGNVSWSINGKNIDETKDYFAFASPAMELFDQLSLGEILEHHKAFCPKFNHKDALIELEKMGLKKFMNKPVSSFSSGMKQRVKLVLAFFNDTEVLFLDEPCSNLDKNGLEQYTDLLLRNKGKRLILVATNQLSTEFPLDGEIIDLDLFKN